jgi:hypothetical protein
MIMSAKHPKISRKKIRPNKVSPNVFLEIRKSSQLAPWVNVKSNNDKYAYLFTGGDSGHGDIHVSRRKNPGGHFARVDLIGLKRYRISRCVFTGDTFNQLTWEPESKRRKQLRTIGNRNTKVQDAKYTIVVEDTLNGNYEIICDPGVKNLP